MEKPQPKQEKDLEPVRVNVVNVKELVNPVDVTVQPSYPLTKEEEIFLRLLGVATKSGANRDPDSLIAEAKVLLKAFKKEFDNG